MVTPFHLLYLADHQQSLCLTCAKTEIQRQQVWIHAWRGIVKRYRRYGDIKILSDAAYSHVCPILLGHCRVYWALLLLCANSTAKQWRAPVQQRFDRGNLIDVRSFGSLFLLCVTAVMWHVIEWKRAETWKGKCTGLVYSQKVVYVSGRIGKRDLSSRNRSICNTLELSFRTQVTPHNWASHI